MSYRKYKKGKQVNIVTYKLVKAFTNTWCIINYNNNHRKSNNLIWTWGHKTSEDRCGRSWGGAAWHSLTQDCGPGAGQGGCDAHDNADDLILILIVWHWKTLQTARRMSYFENNITIGQKEGKLV